MREGSQSYTQGARSAPALALADASRHESSSDRLQRIETRIQTHPTAAQTSHLNTESFPASVFPLRFPGVCLPNGNREVPKFIARNVASEKMIRFGYGLDAPSFFQCAGKLTIDGMEIPPTKGLHGHSGADLLFHVLADALLRA